MLKKEPEICCLPDVTIYCTPNLQNYLRTRTFVIFLDAIPFRKKNENLRIFVPLFFLSKTFCHKKIEDKYICYPE